MASHRAIYKKKPAGFGKVEERRIIRAVAEDESRRQKRLAVYDINRKFEEPTTSSSSSSIVPTELQQGQHDAINGQTEDRRTKLLKWRTEKEIQKKLQRQMKQPAFRVGVYHHKLNSPIFLHQTLTATKSSKPVSPRITRATAKRIAAKKSAGKAKVPEATTNVFHLSKSTKTSTKISTITKILETSFAPENHQFKAPQGLPTLPLFGREALDEKKTDQASVPIYFSPYVVSARGKRASRKEQLHNIELGENTPKETRTVEKNAQSTGTPDRKVESTTSYFRTVAEKEVIRLKVLCQRWTVVKTDASISEDAQLIINQTIGQTNLLINKKIKQFKQLITDCETGSGEQLVTCQDLEGFWDMVYMQVENCDARFANLDQLQQRDWKEEEPTIVKKVVAKKSASVKVIPSKSSSVRDMIRAARRKQMELQRTDASLTMNVGELSAVKFDGGFFMVESPQKIVTPRIVKKSIPSQQRAFSEEAKHRHSAFNLIKLSQILKPLEIKPVEVETDPTIPYVNSQQTPHKSILKRMDTQESASYAKKSQNKVNFSQNQGIANNNISWLSESTNIMFDAEENDVEFGTKLNVKKRLSLSDSDSDLEEAKDQQVIKSEAACDQHINLLGKKVLDNYRPMGNKTSGNSERDDTDQDEPSASSPLREDSVSTLAVRKTRKGVLNEHNEQMVLESPNIQVTKSETPNNKENFMINEQQKENRKTSSPDIPIRRRSTRKSVRFTGEECTACSEVRPVHPMTPRVRRKTTKLLETPNKDGNATENSVDLITLDTPNDLPPRVRRSLRLRNSKQ